MDFKDILAGNEKIERNNKSFNQFQRGRKTLELCELHDLGFEGYKFTWSNGRTDEENIQCKLDRGLANLDYIFRFSVIQVHHLP